MTGYFKRLKATTLRYWGRPGLQGAEWTPDCPDQPLQGIYASSYRDSLRTPNVAYGLCGNADRMKCAYGAKRL